MNLDAVFTLLKARTGLESAALGVQTVLATVRSRVKALGLADADAYAARTSEPGNSIRRTPPERSTRTQPSAGMPGGLMFSHVSCRVKVGSSIGRSARRRLALRVG